MFRDIYYCCCFIASHNDHFELIFLKIHSNISALQDLVQCDNRHMLLEEKCFDSTTNERINWHNNLSLMYEGDDGKTLGSEHINPAFCIFEQNLYRLVASMAVFNLGIVFDRSFALC